jgi:phosphohistidine phosphatase
MQWHNRDMLRLLLLRHSKAAPQDPARDHARPLIERGRSDAKRLGRFIAGQKRTVDTAVHSGAQRAKETLAIAIAEFPREIKVLVEPRLYETTASGFVGALRDLPDAAKTVLVVGHNPSIAEAAHRFVGTGDKDALLRMGLKYPTSGLAIIDFDIVHWRDLAAGAGRLSAFVTPTSLAAED